MSSCTVYVTGMPASATEDDIFDFFTRIGNVAEVHLPSKEQQLASGAAAAVEVVFDKPEDAVSAVSISGSDFQEDIPIHISAVAPTTAAMREPAALATTTAADAVGDTNGNAAAAAAAAPVEPGAGLPARRLVEAERTSKNKIVVSSVYPHTTRAQLRDVFSPCGVICDFRLIPTRHMAFVGYTTEEAYEKALKLDGAIVNGNPVVVRPCPPRDEAQAPASRRLHPGATCRAAATRAPVPLRRAGDLWRSVSSFTAFLLTSQRRLCAPSSPPTAGRSWTCLSSQRSVSPSWHSPQPRTPSVPSASRERCSWGPA
ncbi:hypothetical protein GH5_04691 [Leishmania sp. Ghana 2012 LV757]|uniref:hypothetical protein n=1 Tax=Leishmania sp. Ghana 2012 LV757 TaxID=2803181 RepID=UPI001B6F6546|nr:hypothetical protein GH5_04691 [Leishmania sp. Ghana 2012 LV757]